MNTIKDLVFAALAVLFAGAELSRPAELLRGDAGPTTAGGRIGELSRPARLAPSGDVDGRIRQHALPFAPLEVARFFAPTSAAPITDRCSWHAVRRGRLTAGRQPPS